MHHLDGILHFIYAEIIKIKNLLLHEKLKSLTFITQKKIIALIISSVVVLPLSFIALTLFVFYSNQLRLMSVSTDRESCVKGRFLFPQIYESKESGFDLDFKDKKHGSIYASKLCIKPRVLIPDEDKIFITIQLRKLNLVNRKIEINSESYPSVNNSKLDNKEKIPIANMIQFQLNKEDHLFDYKLFIDDNEAECAKLQLRLTCDIKSLGLVQGSDIKLILTRFYIGKPVENIYDITTGTTEAIKLVGADLSEDEVIFDLSRSFTFDFDKELSQLAQLSMVDADQEISIDLDIKISGRQLIAKPVDKLDKESAYTIMIDQIEATDGSAISAPISIRFLTSDGPRIASSNATTIAYPLSQSLVITLDQEIDISQEINNVVSVSQPGLFSISLNATQVIFTPNETLPLCTSISFTLKEGFLSRYGVESGETSTLSIKTQCFIVGIIGYSRESRPIYSYTFGSGNRTYIFYGAMHGTEVNTNSLLLSWINELDLHYQNIPEDVRIIVVPSLNPDGVRSGYRFNNNGVDLNRNFDTENWQEDSYYINGLVEGGGGSEPFSEPESSAIRDLMFGTNAYLTLSYHSAAGYVISNGVSNTDSISQQYASISGYQYVAPDTTGVFTYPITGDFGDWCGEIGYRCITIELATGWNSEFNYNRVAMWSLFD